MIVPTVDADSSVRLWKYVTVLSSAADRISKLPLKLVSVPEVPATVAISPTSRPWSVADTVTTPVDALVALTIVTASVLHRSIRIDVASVLSSAVILGTLRTICNWASFKAMRTNAEVISDVSFCLAHRNLIVVTNSAPVRLLILQVSYNFCINHFYVCMTLIV